MNDFSSGNISMMWKAASTFMNIYAMVFVLHSFPSVLSTEH